MKVTAVPLPEAGVTDTTTGAAFKTVRNTVQFPNWILLSDPKLLPNIMALIGCRPAKEDEKLIFKVSKSWFPEGVIELPVA
jgi:hypothetical protein